MGHYHSVHICNKYSIQPNALFYFCGRHLFTLTFKYNFREKSHIIGTPERCYDKNIDQ